MTIHHLSIAGIAALAALLAAAAFSVGGWAVRGFTLSIIVVFVAGVAVATFGASMVDARALKRGGRCGPVLLNSLTGPPFS